MDADTPMKVLSWNIQANRGASDEKLDRVTSALARHEPDVVLLQEVFSRAGIPKLLEDRLRTIGLTHFVFSGREDAPEKKYGNVIASRWPLEPFAWSPAPRWPELVVAAKVAYPPGPVTVVGVHIPNGSGNGWEKVAALEALAEGLRRCGNVVILGGDFNEPLATEPRMRSARWVLDGNLEGDFTDLHGVTRPRRDWQAAVEAVLDAQAGGAGWDGTNVIGRMGRSLEATHVTSGGNDRCFDHILTSGHQFLVSAAGYDHDVRLGTSPISDHSIVWASLRPGGEQYDD